MRLAETPEDTQTQGTAFLNKLSSEVRVSLDYFRRQFSSEGSSVSKMLLFSKEISGQEELIAGLKRVFEFTHRKGEVREFKRRPR